MPTLSLSSCWCSHRYQDGYEMLRDMAGLGFTHVELSHGIRIVLVPGVLRAVEEGLIKISSAHNFCPLPAGISQPAPNLFEPSSSDPKEHDQWLRQTKRSIEFAAQVKARVLVCHLGSVKFFWSNPGAALRKFADAEAGARQMEREGYPALLEKAWKKMRRRMPPYWERTQASVKEVLGFAAERGVLLGFENREKFEELPLDEDYPGFIAGLGENPAAGYWHDTGHAQIKELEGILRHEAHLEKMASKLIGFHLHDVRDGDDHQPIGSGVIDFEMVSRFWRPEHTLVLEFSPRLNTEEVLASKARVEELLAARGLG